MSVQQPHRTFVYREFRGLSQPELTKSFCRYCREHDWQIVSIRGQKRFLGFQVRIDSQHHVQFGLHVSPSSPDRITAFLESLDPAFDNQDIVLRLTSHFKEVLDSLTSTP